MKIVNYKIADKEYPMAFTIGASNLLTQKYGDMRKFKDVLSTQSEQEQMQTVLTMFYALLEGGHRYLKMMGEQPPEVPSLNDLGWVIGFDDIPELQKAVMEAMSLGSKRDVIAQATGKNAEATQDN